MVGGWDFYSKEDGVLHGGEEDGVLHGGVNHAT